jgi:transcription initiation factor TFIIH subunit 4
MFSFLIWILAVNGFPLSGYLYTSFASQADYEYVLKYAKELGVVLWESPMKRCFFGSVTGHANIRGFIERRTNANGA